MFSQPMVDDSRPYPLNKQPHPPLPPSAPCRLGRNQSSFLCSRKPGQGVCMVYMTIYWTSEDCHGQAILTLHLSVGQVILFPYFDHCIYEIIFITKKIVCFIIHVSCFLYDDNNVIFVCLLFCRSYARATGCPSHSLKQSAWRWRKYPSLVHSLDSPSLLRTM